MQDIKTPVLLGNFGMILEELRRRGICRSENIPTGDLAEYLVCKALDLKLATNSTKGYDALDSDGLRYQIKGRRVTNRNPSRQLGAIREIDSGHFDFVVAVLFDAQFGIKSAFRFTAAGCRASAKFVERTNSYRLIANDGIIRRTDTLEVTDLLRKAYETA